jgi:hypothetical protein
MGSSRAARFCGLLGRTEVHYLAARCGCRRLVRAPDDDPPVLAAADDEAALVAHSQGGDAAVVARLVPPHLPPLHQVPEAQQATPTAHHSPGVVFRVR